LAVKNSLLVQQVETVVSEEGRRLERVMHNLPAGVLLLDAGRRIVLMNPVAKKNLEYLGGGQTGGTLDALGDKSIDVIIAAGRAIDVATATVPRRVFAVSASVSPDDRETVVVVRDVTDEREQASRVARQDRLAVVGQLAGGIAHDFNNLLLVILASLEFVE